MEREEKVEALMRLPDGAPVECRQPDGAWIPGRVVGRQRWEAGYPQLFVRPLGETPSGQNRARRVYCLYIEGDRESVRLVEELSPDDRLRGNVYADWLEEHRFPDAAKALRAAFPLIEKE